MAHTDKPTTSDGSTTNSNPSKLTNTSGNTPNRPASTDSNTTTLPITKSSSGANHLSISSSDQNNQLIDPKVSPLVDNFGRHHTYLRISVTDRCNLRCFYCMPKEGLKWREKKELLTYEEIGYLAGLFVKMGIRKIRLTGGEPLIRHDLPTLVKQLKSNTQLDTLAMTTNATLLLEHAETLRANGLDALNISLDTFKRERFAQITYQDSYDKVRAGIDKALALKFKSIKVNMVVIAGVNEDEILDFAEFAHANDVNVRFIEFMPFKNNDWNITKVITYKDLLSRIQTKYKLKALDSSQNEVAKDYKMLDGKGTVSFISSMSDSFCARCNRIRLTADGSIKSCLFAPAEINLREALRQGATEEEVRGMILGALYQKPEAHPPAEEIAAQDNRTMIEIGG
jgi:cyclic pyranopterin phosphate synthase